MDAKHDKEKLSKEGPEELLKPFLSLPEEEKTIVRKVYHCPSCRFWALKLDPFHMHVLTKHQLEPTGFMFQCSTCTFKARYQKQILKHIRRKKPKDESHAFASSAPIRPIPTHRYAAQLKTAKIPKRTNSGMFPVPVKTVEDPESSAFLQLELRKCAKRIASTLEKVHASHRRVEEVRKAQQDGIQKRSDDAEANRTKLLQMEEAVRTTAAEIVRLKELKKELDTRVTELTTSRTRVELDLRTAECDALRAQLSLQMAATEADKASAEAVQREMSEKFRTREEDFKKVDQDLKSARREADELEEKLIEANEANVSARQLLGIVQGENSSAPQEITVRPESKVVLGELCTDAEQLVQNYLAEQRKMMGLRYLDTLADVKKKETDLLARLNLYDF